MKKQWLSAVGLCFSFVMFIPHNAYGLLGKSTPEKEKEKVEKRRKEGDFIREELSDRMAESISGLSEQVKVVVGYLKTISPKPQRAKKTYEVIVKECDAMKTLISSLEAGRFPKTEKKLSFATDEEKARRYSRNILKSLEEMITDIRDHAQKTIESFDELMRKQEAEAATVEKREEEEREKRAEEESKREEGFEEEEEGIATEVARERRKREAERKHEEGMEELTKPVELEEGKKPLFREEEEEESPFELFPEEEKGLEKEEKEGKPQEEQEVGRLFSRDWKPVEPNDEEWWK